MNPADQKKAIDEIPELNITVNAPTPEEIQSEQADSGN